MSKEFEQAMLEARKLDIDDAATAIAAGMADEDAKYITLREKLESLVTALHEVGVERDALLRLFTSMSQQCPQIELAFASLGAAMVSVYAANEESK